MDRLELEMNPENGRSTLSKILILLLGVFIISPVVTGLTFYVFFESRYVAHATVTINILTFIGIMYWAINSSKSVYQVEISPSGFYIFAKKTSPFLPTLNGWYNWGDIASYTFDTFDDDPLRGKLILNFNSGQSWTFYYLGFKKTGDLPSFYRTLRNHLPEKEQKL